MCGARLIVLYVFPDSGAAPESRVTAARGRWSFAHMASLDAGTQAVIGALAGMVEITIAQPTVTWKNYLQDGRSPPLNPAVWYRGWTVAVFMQAPVTCAQFGGSRLFEQWLTPEHGGGGRGKVRGGNLARAHQHMRWRC